MTESDPVTAQLGVVPRKVVAVHVNYPSRAAERGTTPRHASYFLKAPSSLTASGVVERPAGTELLGFEGEIALVIGRRARKVAPDDAWSYVGWVTAANDLGVHDLRYADRGSNLRSKSADGYTPVGPAFLPADTVDPERLRIRTWVNRVLVQSDTSDTLLFGFGDLVADLSRTSTLEPGDVILTGTPAGASVAVPGDVVEVELDTVGGAPTTSTGRLRTTVVEGPALAPWGAQPRVDDAERARATGEPTGRGLDGELAQRLAGVGVATLSAQLRKHGLDNVHVDGVHPLRPSHRFVGVARTLRYVPFREDLFAAHGGGFNAQKQVIDSLRPGEVLVMDARRDDTAGTVGDILALRAQVRGAVAIVTDGAVRDAAALADLDVPVFTAGRHPAVLGRRHVPWETDVAVGCGGTVVCPGDVVVGDADGVVVIPPHLAEQVAAAAVEQERQERFVAEQVAAGHGVDGLYPLGEAWRARYDAWPPDDRNP